MVPEHRALRVLPGKSFFLFGPRGTGKSTWVRTELRPEFTVDLLDGATFARLLARPEELRSLVPKGASVVAIDEVQRAPELLNEVHRMIEADGTVFALTGSSARKLRHGGVNRLAGRALSYRMYPFTAAELGAKFSIERSLAWGHLPALLAEPDAARYLGSYVQTYLREEVQQEGLVRNLAQFSRFLEAASFSHAAVLNVTEVARECAVERRSVDNWFQILEDLLLAARLPVFARRAQRAVVAHPKFYFFDVGVFRTIRPRGPLDRPEEIGGAALEGLVFQELRATLAHAGLEFELFFWRTRDGVEVDFVLYGAAGLVAIEVKHSAKVRPADLRGLQTFREEYPIARTLLLYLGDHREQHGAVDVWPAAEALPRLAELLRGA